MATDAGSDTSVRWPVSCMKTSSSVGRRMAKSSGVDVGRAEAAEDRGHHRHPVADRRAHPPRVQVHVGLGPSGAGDDRCGRRQLIGVANDDVDPVAADLRLEPIRAALGDHATGVDHADLIGQLVGLVEVLGGEHDGRAVAHERPDRGPHLVPAARVEAGGRLVREEHARRQDQAGGEVEPATHAAGVLLHRLAAGVGEAEVLEELIGPLLRLAAAEVVEAAEHHQVLLAAEDLVDGRVLADQADPPAHLGRLAHDVEPGHLRPPAVGPEQGGEDAHRRRLAGTVRAEQPDHRPAARPRGRSRRAPSSCRSASPGRLPGPPRPSFRPRSSPDTRQARILEAR